MLTRYTDKFDDPVGDSFVLVDGYSQGYMGSTHAGLRVDAEQISISISTFVGSCVQERYTIAFKASDGSKYQFGAYVDGDVYKSYVTFDSEDYTDIVNLCKKYNTLIVALPETNNTSCLVTFNLNGFTRAYSPIQNIRRDQYVRDSVQRVRDSIQDINSVKCYSSQHEYGLTVRSDDIIISSVDVS